MPPIPGTEFGDELYGGGGTAADPTARRCGRGSGYGRPDPTTAPASELAAIDVSPSPAAHLRPAAADPDLGNILR